MRHNYSLPLILFAMNSLSFGQASAPAPTQPAAEPHAASMPAATSPARPIKRQPDAKILEQFIQHVKSSAQVEPAAKNAIDQLWAQRRAQDDPRAFMTSALAVMSAPYKTASDSIEAGDAAAALKSIEPVTQNEDFYLSTHASLLKARALVEQDRLDDAESVLQGLHERRDEITSRTLLGPELLFLLGFCELSNLDYENALATFRAFEKSYPDAPEQYRLPVRQMVQELAGRKPEGLGDVSDLMTFSGRQLKHARTGQVVRTRQDRAVELLTKLIDEAEQREQEQQQQQQNQQQGAGGKSGRPKGNQQPQKGAERSVAPPGQGRVGDLHHSGRARPGEQWGQMRPEERERVMQALRQNFPSRYRQLVEQYYKQLSKEE